MVTPVPDAVALAADAMRGFPSSWALCGGWGVDAWLGAVSRPHPDVDISVFHDRQRDVLDHFQRWNLNGHDAADEDTEEHELGHPAHVHARRSDGLHLDIQLDRRNAERWLFAPELSLPVEACIRTSPWGVPTVVPAVLLYYKGAGEIRPHDEADFGVLLPRLGANGRAWLATALRSQRPDHPWLSVL